MIERAIADGADPNTPIDAAGPSKVGSPDRWPPIVGAAFLGHADGIAVLAQYGADVNGSDEHGGTALMSACASPCGDAGALASVKKLLDLGASVHACAADGTQAIDIAANLARLQQAPLELVERLLRAGANPGSAQTRINIDRARSLGREHPRS